MNLFSMQNVILQMFQTIRCFRLSFITIYVRIFITFVIKNSTPSPIFSSSILFNSQIWNSIFRRTFARVECWWTQHRKTTSRRFQQFTQQLPPYLGNLPIMDTIMSTSNHSPSPSPTTNNHSTTTTPITNSTTTAAAPSSNASASATAAMAKVQRLTQEKALLKAQNSVLKKAVLEVGCIRWEESVLLFPCVG